MKNIKRHERAVAVRSIKGHHNAAIPIDPIERMRKRQIAQGALDFVDRAPNPLEGMDSNLAPEQQFTETVKRLEGGLSGAMKKQAEQFVEEGRTDYYAVICFEQGEQLDAFMRGIDYPDPTATYIDGRVLAKLLKIDIPKSTFRLKPLRAPDAALARLVKRVPKI